MGGGRTRTVPRQKQNQIRRKAAKKAAAKAKKNVQKRKERVCYKETFDEKKFTAQFLLRNMVNEKENSEAATEMNVLRKKKLSEAEAKVNDSSRVSKNIFSHSNANEKETKKAANKTRESGTTRVSESVSTMTSVKARFILHSIWKEFAPSKLDRIDHVLIKYKGRETRLLKAVIEKYNVSPTKLKILFSRSIT
eukprot:g1204.t1